MSDVTQTPNEGSMHVLASAASVLSASSVLTMAERPTSEQPASEQPAIESNVNASCATTLTWELIAQLLTVDGKPVKLIFRIKTKQNRFAVVVPAKATSGKGRTEIGFSKCEPEGISLAFGKYIYQRLSAVVGGWKTLLQAREWVSKKSEWRNRVRKDWQQKSNLLRE